MKLPIQARPIMRSASSAKISDALMRGIAASECDWGKCGWITGVCAAFTPGGPLAVSGCLLGVAGTECRDCIGEAVEAMMNPKGGDHHAPMPGRGWER